ncbi:unnamed protein product [Notodromas monacha]|uniref:Large ribosomal subunit protein eL21 n=1 Tax=Notodromas monacha TaxID=399045 RepID=A0A7R9BWP6_9CRUS|nr:unnamed protein product [Notodromas monacha]CAG0922046.1 unnamed protein product [Notodromas monacha]
MKVISLVQHWTPTPRFSLVSCVPKRQFPEVIVRKPSPAVCYRKMKSSEDGNSAHLSAKGSVPLNGDAVDVDFSFSGGHQGSAFIEIRAVNAEKKVDLWTKLNEEDFSNIAGNGCSLERFSAEIFSLLNSRGSGSRRLELTTTSDPGTVGVGLALIHVNGVWEAEELVIPLADTPANVKLAHAWSLLVRKAAESDALARRIDARERELESLCPETRSLIALRESVDLLKGQVSSDRSTLAVSAVDDVEDDELAELQKAIEDCRCRREESELKIKALDNLAHSLSAACGPLVEEKKLLEAKARADDTVNRVQRREDGLKELRGKRDRARFEAARIRERVQASKRRVHHGLLPGHRAKTEALADSSRRMAVLELKIKRREQVGSRVARELMAETLEMAAWEQRRADLERLNAWLGARMQDEKARLERQVSELRLAKESIAVASEMAESLAKASEFEYQLEDSFLHWFFSPVMTEKCVRIMLVDFDVFHVDCMKTVISKVLGYGIILGSIAGESMSLGRYFDEKMLHVCVDFPSENPADRQVVQGKERSRDFRDVRVTRITGHHVQRSLQLCPKLSVQVGPLRMNDDNDDDDDFTWGEGASLALQTSIIGALVLFYEVGPKFGGLYLIVYSLLTSFLVSPVVPVDVLWFLNCLTIPFVVFGKSIQAYTNYRNGHTGQLSIITVSLLFLGAVARIFTSLHETGDLVLVSIYCTSTLMTNPKGYRRGTRYMFSRDFRKKGYIPLSTYMKVYKVGDIVDIKGCGAVTKGMPHKSYHGKTGRVFNVTQHALGVIVNKRVRGKVLPKRINVRIEHVKHSQCRKDFLERVKSNEAKKREAREKGIRVQLKRQPVGPRPGHFVSTKDNTPELVQPIPYEFIA